MTPEEQKSILEKREAKKKIRCKNWPNCKDPNCEYTHPTQTVRIIFILLKKKKIKKKISVLIFQIVCLVINVVTFILMFLVNMVFIVRELDVLIHILQDGILEWECFLM